MSVWVRDRWQPINFPLFSIYTGIYSIYTALFWVRISDPVSLSNKQYQLRNKKPRALLSTNLIFAQNSKIQSYIYSICVSKYMFAIFLFFWAHVRTDMTAGPAYWHTCNLFGHKILFFLLFFFDTVIAISFKLISTGSYFAWPEAIG